MSYKKNPAKTRQVIWTKTPTIDPRAVPELPDSDLLPVRIQPIQKIGDTDRTEGSSSGFLGAAGNRGPHSEQERPGGGFGTSWDPVNGRTRKPDHARGSAEDHRRNRW